MLLNLNKAPTDPIERIVWLDGVMEAAKRECDAALAQAYFTARLERRFDAAVRLGRASRKRALALSRAHNEATGRTVRWNDGQDPTSSDFHG